MRFNSIYPFPSSYEEFLAWSSSNFSKVSLRISWALITTEYLYSRMFLTSDSIKESSPMSAKDVFMLTVFGSFIPETKMKLTCKISSRWGTFLPNTPSDTRSNPSGWFYCVIFLFIPCAKLILKIPKSFCWILKKEHNKPIIQFNSMKTSRKKFDLFSFKII